MYRALVRSPVAKALPRARVQAARRILAKIAWLAWRDGVAYGYVSVGGVMGVWAGCDRVEGVGCWRWGKVGYRAFAFDGHC